tara:strand:- start:905 stop:1552 length:648 start_codon:yes stop_codon:yes gene_type:complete
MTDKTGKLLEICTKLIETAAVLEIVDLQLDTLKSSERVGHPREGYGFAGYGEVRLKVMFKPPRPMLKMALEIDAEKSPPKPRPKRARRDPLDGMFSEFVRRRALARVGGCERCLTEKHDTTREDGTTRPAYMQLECSHFIGRTTHAVRWDEDNAAGLCSGCHMYLEHHPEEHQPWWVKHLGQNGYDMLQARRRLGTKPDRNALGIYYKAKLKEGN